MPGAGPGRLVIRASLRGAGRLAGALLLAAGAILSVSPAFAQPAAPTGFEVAQAGSIKAKLAWNEPAAGAGIVRHEVRFRAGSAAFPVEWTNIPSSRPGQANASGYILPGLTAETAYDFELRAVDGGGPGTAASASATTLVPFTARFSPLKTYYEGTHVTMTIAGLADGTSYDVQVRATNGEGTGDWSASGTGSTDANAAPSFDSLATFNAAENQTTAGTVVATDDDSEDKIERYDITGGADQALFMVIASSGDLEFRDAPNFEDAQDQDTNNQYVVTVQATSGAGEREKTATQTITVTVTDVAGEKPAAPAVPTVSSASVTSLNVSWAAPGNAGPAITDYDVQYRAGTSGGWTDRGHDGTDTTATITGLAAGTSHQVQVRATNAEGTGDWSASGSGSTYANEAEAQDIALVSNIGEVPSSEANANPENYTGGTESRVAQRFTTGPSTGYSLHSVLLNLRESVGGTGVKVGVHRNNNAGNPGRELVVLGNPGEVFGSNRTFSAASPLSLEASTSYWVVVSNTGSNTSRFFVSVTASS